ncbi:alanine dehydrogenase [Agitococcus lubricus]|uniref:alanine dehydrogenase n=1 Tax=Agitococcus lubricus TaxID=1077255 RepID=A0A2T5IWM2_9GAMM|nr:alanine dehydrogenase [Agitococcus lubricus]PTQ88311.1 L-alanine dehydrogenase [Agitococcus lubricus]
MRIGIPKERKLLESRIALTPSAVATLVLQGHQVFVEQGAGQGSGYHDSDYLAIGAQIAPNLAAVYVNELVVKVKEPTVEELTLLRPRQILFCYLHLAAYPQVLSALLAKKVTGLAFETLTVNQRLPLLAPMSAIAGRLAVQLGSQYLQKQYGGAGVLLSGSGYAQDAGRVMILGAGVAGSQAALLAHALGAEVYVFDRYAPALSALSAQQAAIHTYLYDAEHITQLLAHVDLVIGAVLITGAQAPTLLTQAQQQCLAKGRVIIDIAIDQGGCVEGIHATDWQQPIYWREGIGYIAVTNMPAAVPRSSTQALSAAILPYVLQVAHQELAENPILQTAINVENGIIKHDALRNMTL